MHQLLGLVCVTGSNGHYFLTIITSELRNAFAMVVLSLQLSFIVGHDPNVPL